MLRRNAPIPPHLYRFVRALHARFLLVRGAERVGACVLLACGAAIAVVPIILWRGSGMPLPAVSMLLGFGFVIGILLGIVRRPSRMDSAAEADRQLRLDDLIGTALSIDPATDDPWARTVLSLADARCRELSPSRVLLNRWGGRAWGGAGLATALVLTIATMVTRPQPSRAGMSATDPFNSGPAARTPRWTDASADDSQTRQPSIRPSPAETANPSDDSAVAQTARPTSNETQDSIDRATAARNDPASGDPNHIGTGSAGTEGLHSSLPPAANASSKSDTVGHSRTASGGQADTRADTGGNGPTAATGTAGSQKTSSSPPPWTAASWPQDRARALEKLRSSPSYDSYRELIRSYFDRQ